jgi:hypothetical protein
MRTEIEKTQPSTSKQSRESEPSPRSNPGAGPIRCQGEPISLSHVVTDEPGYEEIRYVPENDSVLYVAVRSNDGPERFESMPVSKFSEIHGADAAYTRVREVTIERLGTDEFSKGIGDGRLILFIYGQTHAISLHELVETAPRSATVDVAINGYKRSINFPVYADHTTEIHPD